MPADVRELIDEAVRTEDVAPLWREFRKCYRTEAQAIEAAKKNIIVLLPFINSRENIYFCFRILGDELGFSDAERVSQSRLSTPLLLLPRAAATAGRRPG